MVVHDVLQRDLPVTDTHRRMHNPPSGQATAVNTTPSDIAICFARVLSFPFFPFLFRVLYFLNTQGIGRKTPCWPIRDIWASKQWS